MKRQSAFERWWAKMLFHPGWKEPYMRMAFEAGFRSGLRSKGRKARKSERRA